MNITAEIANSDQNMIFLNTFLPDFQQDAGKRS